MVKKTFASKQDLKKLKNEIIDALIYYLRRNYVTKEEIEEAFESLKKRIYLLPTKTEFFEKMDEIAGDYEKFLQERDTLLYQMERIKDKVGIV